MYKCIAKPFNLHGHDYLRDLYAYIIFKDIEPVEKRLMYETFFINFFKRFNIKIYNDKIPKLFAYNEKRF